jgi:hypothetical protein
MMGLFITYMKLKKEIHRIFTNPQELFIALLFGLPLLLCIILFFFKAILYIDLDFGWEVRMGDWIVHNGIPHIDPLTYTMSQFPYVDHEWITSVLFYLITTYLGIFWLGILFSCSIFISVFVLVRRSFTRYTLLPLLVSCVILLSFFGIRAQVIGWILFATILSFIFNEKLWAKWKFCLPFVILLWANMHGSFGIGLVVLFFFGLHLVWKRRFDKAALLVFSLCLLATFVTPYGYGVWMEIYHHLINTNAKDRIGEWMPLWYTFTFQTVFYAVYMIVSYVFILAFLWKRKEYRLLLLTCLFMAGWSTVRHIPFYVLCSLPLVNEALSVASRTYAKKKSFDFFFHVVSYIFILFCLIELMFCWISLRDTQEKQVYPVLALQYLHQHPPKHNMFSVWEWGGYLDWKFPEKKVFIDGRTLIWQQHTDSKNESTNVYKEMEHILLGNISLSTTAKQYDIDTLLVPYALTQYEPIKKQLTPNAWKIVYKDSVSVIYKKDKE